MASSPAQAAAEENQLRNNRGRPLGTPGGGKDEARSRGQTERVSQSGPKPRSPPSPGQRPDTLDKVTGRVSAGAAGARQSQT